MEKSEHFLTRGYEKIKKSRLRAFARTRAKKENCIGHFCVRDDPTMRSSKFFDEKRRWGHWGHWGCWGCRGHWGCKGSKAWKITSEDFWVIPVLEFSFFDVLKRKIFAWNLEISFWTLVPFLSEAVEAGWCYFFKNWLMKLKCPNVRNIQIPSL